ncbi:hypothetical protein [Acinetobacter nectaris]|uniref:hypothetical protein n=1 Tax=Acinetobacter nectaris TaxID=1219382 RepID=UPI001F1F209B|nr:hypothetical protein [Acinetobacter nectaris]MCF9035028.1 hypothetical protein [Acinetobacter nectaris]
MQNISSEVDRFIKIKNLLSTFIEKHDFRRVNQYYQVIYQNNLKYIEKYDLPLYEDAVLLRNFDILFSNFDLDQESYLQLLNTWVMADEGFLICILLGDYWAEAAIQYDYNNSDFSEIRKLFVGVSTYWYLKALEHNIFAPDIYISLMDLYEKTLEVCDLRKIYKDYAFNVGEYSNQALNIFYQQLGELPSRVPLRLALREPVDEEYNQPSLYWFNLSIERQVSVMAFSRYYSNLLHKYNGNYREVDLFLYQDICQKQSHLLLQQIYYLRYIHEFKQIFSSSEGLYLEKIKNAQELIGYFNTLVLSKRQMVDCYVQQILFYQAYLDSECIETSEKAQIKHKIYQLAQSIVLDYAPEFQSEVSLHHAFLKQLILLFSDKTLPFIDDAHLRGKVLSLICIWQYNITFMTLSLALLDVPDWGVDQDLQISFEKIWQKRTHHQFNTQLEEAWQYLLLGGEYDALIKQLIQFANAGHTPSMMHLFSFYSGKLFHFNVPQYIDLKHAQDWLEKALLCKDTNALMIQGQRLLEKSLDEVLNEEMRILFAEEAFKYLEEVVHHNLVQAEVSYGHAKFILQNEHEKTLLLQFYFPKLLEKYKFNKAILAQIAYIYAYAAYYGLGIERNLYLACYWGNNAVSLDPMNERYQILYANLIQPTGWFMKKIQYKKRIKVSRGNLPLWMKQTIPIFERHLVF